MVLPWISTFLLLYAGGTLLFTASIPRAGIGDRFYRVNGYIALFLAVTAALTSGVLGPKWTTFWPILAYITALFALTVTARASWFKHYTVAFLSMAAGALIVSLAGRPGEFHLFPLFHYALSSFALGAALVSMLLGHSYLESDNQSFDLLINSCRALILALILRAIVSAVSIGPAMGRIQQWMNDDVVLVLFAVMRVVVGIIFAGILSWMALSCARIKSNQSATGILYVVVGFVIIGELVAAYLGIEKGVFF